MTILIADQFKNLSWDYDRILAGRDWCLYSPYKQEELIVKEIEEFWPGVIAYGFPVYINGSTGLGKTNVFLKVGADATRGIFPPGVKDGYLEEPVKGEPIKMFYVSTENPVCEIVYPALLYNGADPTMFRIQNEKNGHFILCREDLDAVMEDFAPRLIIIDAFQEHLPDGCNLSDGDHMSKLMQELENYAYENKVALVLIGNDAKGSEGRSDANKMLGSGVIARRARSLVTVKESDHERFLQVTKRLGFKKKEEALIGYRFGANERLEFYVNDTETDNPGKKETTRDRVVRFLRAYLADGPHDREDVFKAAERVGITRDNLYDYKDDAGVDNRPKKGDGNKREWYLRW